MVIDPGLNQKTLNPDTQARAHQEANAPNRGQENLSLSVAHHAGASTERPPRMGVQPRKEDWARVTLADDHTTQGRQAQVVQALSPLGPERMHVDIQ